MNIAVTGVSGRMGRTIFGILNSRGHRLHCGFEIATSPFVGTDAGLLIGLSGYGADVCEISAERLAGAAAVIDFTAPAATMSLLDAAVESKTPIVIGTTGIDEQGKARIADASKKIPVLFAPNMSIGVNILFKILENAASILPEGYDVEIFEAHHKMKKDAPSGTALRLYDIVKENSPRHKNSAAVCDREGIIGERTQEEIGMQVLRGGDIVGEHTVFFVGMGERIELTHRATSRDMFANGAVKAAEYIAGKPAGSYSIYDVLGLK